MGGWRLVELGGVQWVGEEQMGKVQWVGGAVGKWRAAAGLTALPGRQKRSPSKTRTLSSAFN